MNDSDETLVKDLRSHSNGGLADTRTLDNGASRIEAMNDEIDQLACAVIELTAK